MVYIIPLTVVYWHILLILFLVNGYNLILISDAKTLSLPPHYRLYQYNMFHYLINSKAVPFKWPIIALQESGR